MSTEFQITDLRNLKTKLKQIIRHIKVRYLVFKRGPINDEQMSKSMWLCSIQEFSIVFIYVQASLISLSFKMLWRTP